MSINVLTILIHAVGSARPCTITSSQIAPLVGI